VAAGLPGAGDSVGAASCSERAWLLMMNPNFFFCSSSAAAAPLFLDVGACKATGKRDILEHATQQNHPQRVYCWVCWEPEGLGISPRAAVEEKLAEEGHCKAPNATNVQRRGASNGEKHPRKVPPPPHAPLSATRRLTRPATRGDCRFLDLWILRRLLSFPKIPPGSWWVCLGSTK
jgi:hypothetical protein